MKIKFRLLNFLIDSAIFMMMVLIASFFLKNIIEQEQLRIYAIISYYAYYFILEASMGKTIGKMITKTKVVDANNKPLKIWQVFLRTLARLIPIDFISYLFGGNGIHDYLSRTRLIKY